MSRRRCASRPARRSSRPPTRRPSRAAHWPSRRERAIGENELQNRVELARREQQLVEQDGANQRLRAQEEADTHELVESARLRVERERAEIQGAMPPAVLLALALRELAGQLGPIDHLTITPDLLAPLLERLGER
jgi:hypothetical protein